jgi:hypothetical protein
MRNAYLYAAGSYALAITRQLCYAAVGLAYVVALYSTLMWCTIHGRDDGS